MDELVSKIDHKLARKIVERFNWANVSQRILNTFENCIFKMMSSSSKSNLKPTFFKKSILSIISIQKAFREIFFGIS